MESIVLIARYPMAPHGPNRTNQNRGEIMPSTVFSATVSMVARVISLSSSSLVLRPTIHPTLRRASDISCFLNKLAISMPASAKQRGLMAMYRHNKDTMK